MLLKYFIVSLCALSPAFVHADDQIRVIGIDRFANISSPGKASAIVEKQATAWFPNVKAENPGCNRGEPTSWLNPKHPKIKSVQFRQISDTQSVEAAVLTTGETITVVNWGCESYAVSIRYTFGEAAPNLNEEFWFQKSAEALKLVQGLEKKENGNPFDLGLDAKALTAQLEKINTEGVSFQNPVSVEGDGLGLQETSIEFMRVGQLPDKKGSFLEITLIKNL